ncbi:MAG: hypothetical protein IJ415_03160, partial [Clostridia bacterium]|nr:hypothetical protein [Clostridia bacterium]
VLEITPRELSITTSQGGYYGNEIDLDETNYSIVEGSIVNNDVLGFTMTTTATKKSSVGSFNIEITCNNSNYSITSSNSYYRIYRRPITIIPSTQNSVYGENVELTQTDFTIENLANNDKIEVSLSTEADSTSVVGEYVITASYESSSVTNNYTISLKSGTLNITKRAITVKAENQTSMYGDDVVLESTCWNVSVGNLVNNDEITVKLSTIADNTSVVEDYDITLSVSGGDSANYDITTENGTLTIVQREIKIQILNQDEVFNKEIVLKQNLYDVISDKGIVNGDELNIVLQTTAQKGDAIGDYDITLTYNNSNYDVEFENGILTIKGVEVVISIQSQSFTYGEEIILNQELFSSEEDVSELEIELLTKANSLSSVGNYSITATSSNPNVKLTYVEGVLTIIPRELSLAIENQTCEYGNVNIDQTRCELGETVNGDVVEVILLTDATNSSSIGEYNIVASTNNANYTLIYDNAILTIEPKKMTIYLSDQTTTYGDVKLDNSKFTLSENVINGDNLNIELKTEATNTSSVGDYEIDFAYENENYDLTGENGKLTITPRPITIKINQTSTYGEVLVLDSSAYVVVENEIVNNDDLKLQLSLGVDGITSIGIYEISATSANANYDVTIVSALLEVEPKDIEVIAEDQTSIYGEIVSLDASKYYVVNDALVSGDDIGVKLTTTANNKSNAGTYDIVLTCSGEDVNNYNITIINGTLTIAKRPITIKISDQESCYGIEPDLENLYEVVSLNQIVNGDELNIEIVTTATKVSPVGTYSLTLTYDNDNYEVTYIEGQLTIVVADGLVITILDQTFVYGNEINLNHLLFEVSEGEVNKESLGVTLETNANSTSNVGNGYEIDLKDWSNKNYKISVINKGKLTITQRPITITLEDQTRIYGENGLDNEKFILSEEVDAGIILSTEADEKSEANKSYPISFDYVNQNYSVTATNSAVLTIKPRSLKIKTSQFCTYGANIVLDNEDFYVEDGQVVNGDNLGIAFTTTAKKYDSVGSYVINFIYSNSNYLITLDENSELKILPRQIGINIEQNKYYGDKVSLVSTKYSVIYGGVVNNDNLNLVLNTTAQDTSPVGEYPIEVVENNPNYEVVLGTGKLNVCKRIVFIEAQKSAEYGNYFALDNTYSIVEGNIAFATDELNVKFSTDATSISNAGEYNLYMTYANDNYDVELRPTSYFRVLPRKITIQIGDETSTYGNQVVVDQNNYSIISGTIVNQDVLGVNLSTNASLKSDVGVYAITGNANNSNYQVGFRQGSFTISKRQITVKLKNQKIARGITFEIDQNAYEIVEGEIVEGDDLELEIYSKAKMFSVMGNYKLMAKFDNDNYDVKIINGNLFLNISFIDIAVITLSCGFIAFIIVKVVKHRKAKKENQKLFDKWIKW